MNNVVAIFYNTTTVRIPKETHTAAVMLFCRIQMKKI